MLVSFVGVEMKCIEHRLAGSVPNAFSLQAIVREGFVSAHLRHRTMTAPFPPVTHHHGARTRRSTESLRAVLK
jgi:hypothetical protein